MQGCGASCLLDMGGQLLQGGRAIYKYIYQEELSVCVCVFNIRVCTVRTRHNLCAQDIAWH